MIADCRWSLSRSGIISVSQRFVLSGTDFDFAFRTLVARMGSAEAVELLFAEGQDALFKRMVIAQIRSSGSAAVT